MSLLGFVLLIGAFVSANFASRLLSTVFPFSYPVALAVTIIPFWWFVKSYAGMSIDWIDYGSVCCLFIVISVVEDVFDMARLHSIVLLVTAFTLCMPVLGWCRRKLGARRMPRGPMERERDK
jgi:hypothetical protein